MTQAAYAWRRCNDAAEHVLRDLRPSQWVEVRYEEYCRDPYATLSRLFEFLAVERQGSLNNFRAVEQHVVGNGMRLDATSQIQLDERWRTELKDGDLRAFDRIAGEMNRRYGYE